MVELLLFSILVMTGCNTIEGAGKDVQKAGEGMEKSAQEHKKHHQTDGCK
jgi:predicted small secreted protein